MISKMLRSMLAVAVLTVAVGASYFALTSGDSAEAGRWSPRVPDPCETTITVSLNGDSHRWFDRGCVLPPI